MSSPKLEKVRILRKLWFIIPMLAVLCALGTWTLLAPGNAIVDANVNLVGPYGNGFLAQVESIHAWHPRTSEGIFFEVWSKCTLSVNQIVDIKVPVSGLALGNQPESFEVALYRASGSEFIPWDGC